MKTCPSCQRTFEDGLKFCQNDGTPLVEDDPFKTMVAGQPPAAGNDDPLELPDFDPNKTMVASSQEQADLLSAPDPLAGMSAYDESVPEPIPSPSDPFSAPPPPVYAEPEQVYTPQPSPFDSPFAEPTQQFGGSQPTQEWSAPPAPAPQWQDQGNFSGNTPFQPPPAGAGQSKGLATAAMIVGIISIPGICCYVGILMGPIAMVMGFIARSKAQKDPMNFGGEGFALAGMITGGVGTLLALLYIIYIVVILATLR